MRLSSPIYKLKRQAKLLARSEGIRLYEALNEIARKEGYKDWSLLALHYARSTPAQNIMSQLRVGDLVLVGARPGHGKTLLGLELVALAQKEGQAGFVFTLEDNECDIWDRFESLGYTPRNTNPPLVVDTSEGICADYIIERVGRPLGKTLIVVDYLQQLDQQRRHPSVAEQVRSLKKFAVESGTVIVLISQIDRSFELGSNPLPCVADVRMPNRFDLHVFDKLVFLHDGEVQLERAA